MLFRESAASVATRILEGSLALHLTENFRHLHGRSAGQSEIRSWERSLPALVNALMDAGLGDVEVLIEYSLPLTSKRADAVLAGVHPTTGEPSYVIVELKQWSAAYPEEDEPLLCRIDAYPDAVLNPIEQVRGYCEYLLSFNGALERSRRPSPGWRSCTTRTKAASRVCGASRRTSTVAFTRVNSAVRSSTSCARGSPRSPARRRRTCYSPARSGRRSS